MRRERKGETRMKELSLLKIYGHIPRMALHWSLFGHGSYVFFMTRRNNLEEKETREKVDSEGILVHYLCTRYRFH